MAPDPKVVVSVLYPKECLSRFDTNYYISHHIPLCKKGWGPLGMTNFVFSETETDTGYAFKAVMFWKDMESWEASKKETVTDEIMGDIKVFTDVKPTMVVGKVLTFDDLSKGVLGKIFK